MKENKTPVLKTFDSYLDKPINNSFVYLPCDPTEVALLIDELNPTKGTGPNGIPANILKMIRNIVSIPLSKIYNISLLTGVQPNKLKLAHIIPIFKKGS